MSEPSSYQSLAEFIYIVTVYGCNSSPLCVWPAKSRTFKLFKDAYDYFLHVAPPLHDPDNKATRRVREEHNIQLDLASGEAFVVFEYRTQDAGYYEGDACCAKRPYGAVLAASRVN